MLSDDKKDQEQTIEAPIDPQAIQQEERVKVELPPIPLDFDEVGTVLEVKRIDQSPEAQWALLRRCPFKIEHLTGIIEALEKERDEALSHTQTKRDALKRNRDD